MKDNREEMGKSIDVFDIDNDDEKGEVAVPTGVCDTVANDDEEVGNQQLN